MTRFTGSATGRSAPCRSASAAKVHLEAVKALLIEAIDPRPVASADFVADGLNVRGCVAMDHSPEWM